jgi:HK97 gp10 family phage protein
MRLKGSDVVEIKLTGLDNVVSLLNSLPKEVVSKRGGPVAASLKKGAYVIAKPAALNIARAVDSLGGEDHESTGLLQRSVIVSRGKALFSGNGERYLVRIKRRKYDRKGKTVTTLKTAQLLEYGSGQQPAEPWLRPAFEQNAEKAITTTRDELLRSIDRIVARLKR